MLAGAVWENQRIRFAYRRGERGGVVDRLVDPLGLVLKGGIWYLVGRSGGNFRTYRVSRVVMVSVLPERFERPEGFDLANHWDTSTAAYERDIERLHVTVRLAPESLDEFADVCGSRRMAAATRSPDPDVPGHIRMRVAFDWTDEAISAALRLGTGMEVLEPEWLRRSIFESASAIIERYAVGPVAALPG
jgi:predicted DNA-binding transcriptional regulator YafY